MTIAITPIPKKKIVSTIMTPLPKKILFVYSASKTLLWCYLKLLYSLYRNNFFPVFSGFSKPQSERYTKPRMLEQKKKYEMQKSLIPVLKAKKQILRHAFRLLTKVLQ